MSFAAVFFKTRTEKNRRTPRIVYATHLMGFQRTLQYNIIKISEKCRIKNFLSEFEPFFVIVRVVRESLNTYRG